jgi:hypothetical protein
VHTLTPGKKSAERPQAAKLSVAKAQTRALLGDLLDHGDAAQGSPSLPGAPAQQPKDPHKGPREFLQTLSDDDGDADGSPT